MSRQEGQHAQRRQLTISMRGSGTDKYRVIGVVYPEDVSTLKSYLRILVMMSKVAPQCFTRGKTREVENLTL